MSTWLFDLGNTRLKCAELHDDGRLGAIVTIAHDGERFEGDPAQALPHRVDAACIASVAPAALRVALLEALLARTARVSFATTQARFGGIEVAYAQPGRLGIDRYLALLASRARGIGAVLVVGIGTALTIDLLDADGRHRGGRIAPSPTLMRDALHARAHQLPATGGRFVDFADDTADALSSGCDGAALALIEDSRSRAQRLLDAPVALLAHGGGHERVRDALRDAIEAPALVLEGLALWSRATA